MVQLPKGKMQRCRVKSPAGLGGIDALFASDFPFFDNIPWMGFTLATPESFIQMGDRGWLFCFGTLLQYAGAKKTIRIFIK